MRLSRRWPAQGRSRGQALVEFSMVFPLFLLVLFSIIALGLYVFYNQQLENAAREAARYAAVHSASSICPTVSRIDPILTMAPERYGRNCDAPEDGWPEMTGIARSAFWGGDASRVHVTACWSGYVDPSGNHDALPQPPNVFTGCTIGGIDPRQDAGSLACPPPVPAHAVVNDASGDDKASSLAFANGVHYPTTITVYACYRWTPPMSGFLFVPSEFVMRAVVTEAMQRQQ
jgi:hypothetical protein